MKSFFSKHGSVIFKLNLYQFGSAFLGLMLAMAAAGPKNDWLFLATSIFSVAFYELLIYTLMWEYGAQERIRIDSGRAPDKPFDGLIVMLTANVPNILLAILIAVGTLFGSTSLPFAWEWAGGMAGVCKVIARIWQAMYMGLLQLYMPNNILAYFLIVLPSLFFGTCAYMLGMNNFRILSIFGIKTKPKKSGK